MQALAEKNIMIESAFLDTMVNVLGGEQALPDYILATSFADFTGMPPIHFWWGYGMMSKLMWLAHAERITEGKHEQ